MYSGTTFNHKSGNAFGVHQKIDKAAYSLVSPYLLSGNFPESKQILHFEGKNGPDGIKRKAPSKDEPWHFIDPTSPKDGNLLQDITAHHRNLSAALRKKDAHRAAFEAAWLAHAIVDGLTPAHHYPFEEHLETLRGEGIETRTSIRKKIVIPGGSGRERIRNNWAFWGAKGVMTTHLLFELGVASAVTPFPKLRKLTQEELHITNETQYIQYYLLCLQRVNELHMYERFSEKGWTAQLARQTRTRLIPEITYAVAIGWLSAYKTQSEHPHSV